MADAVEGVEVVGAVAEVEDAVEAAAKMTQQLLLLLLLLLRMQ